MKNSFTKKIVSLVALLTLPIMTGCGKTDTPSKQDSHSVEVSSKDQPSTGGEETHTHTFESHSAVAATCSKTGNKAYDFCTGCQKYFINGQEVSADSITLPIDPTNHNLKNVASTAADCKTMGVIAHQECNDCHKLFVNGVEKTTSELQGYGEHKLSDVAAVPHTCTVDGKIAYKHCSVCGKNFINGVEKSDNDLKVPGGQGHDFSGDSLICKNGCGAYKALYNGEYVTLMTAHTAKGLEFPVVFVVRFNEGVFPSQRAVLESGYTALEEERRLAYVAITRAMKKLYLTYSSDFSYVIGSSLIPSKFLAESGNSPKENKQNNGFFGGSYIQPRPINKPFSFNDGPNQSFQSDEPKKQDFSQDVNDVDNWAVGDIVIHRKFGKGVVTCLEGDGIITVVFDEHGEKSMMGSSPALSKGGHEA